MPATRRKFTDEEKLEILHQASQSGITEVLRKHHLSYSVFTRWKQKFMEQGIHPDVSHVNTEMRLLQEENTRLKKIIADQALALELKNEELKRLNSFSK